MNDTVTGGILEVRKTFLEVRETFLGVRETFGNPRPNLNETEMTPTDLPTPFPSALTERIFEDRQAPWAMLLVSAVIPPLRASLLPAARAPFEELDRQLATWWPEQRTPIFDIYNGPFMDAWAKYDEMSFGDPARVADIQQLLCGAYVQLRVALPFERLRHPERRGLASDITDISVHTLQTLLDHCTIRTDTVELNRLMTWVEKVTGEAPPSWGRARDEILARGELFAQTEISGTSIREDSATDASPAEGDAS